MGVLATYSYDALGRRSNVAFGNGTAQATSFDNADRLTSLTANLAGTAQDFSATFSYNPAGQIASTTRSPDAYAWNGHYNIDRLYTINGLNQILTAGQLNLTYDARGNLKTSGTSTYGYNADNLLTSAPGAALSYDGLGRMTQIYTASPTTITRFAYDGTDLIAEFDGNNTLLRRYVHGPGTDEPIVWYEGSGTTNRRFLARDERGSIIAVSDSAGASLAINRYDEYGIPATTNMGRFGYTGQLWLPEIGMSYYKARIYSPTLGRFLQTDPTGTQDGMNLYAYVRGDPVNYVDPTGLESMGGGCTGSRMCWLIRKDGSGNPVGAPVNSIPGPSQSQGRGGGSITVCRGCGISTYTITDQHGIDTSVVTAHIYTTYYYIPGLGSGSNRRSNQNSSCSSHARLYRNGVGLQRGGEVITDIGLGLAVVGELAEPMGGGTAGLGIADFGGLVSAVGQGAKDIAGGRPAGEIALRFGANVAGGAILGRALRGLGAGHNATAEAISSNAAGRIVQGITDWLSPDWC